MCTPISFLCAIHSYDTHIHTISPFQFHCSNIVVCVVCVISLEQPAIFGFGPFSTETCSIYNLHLITLHAAELRFTPPLQPLSIKRTRSAPAARHIHFSVSQISAHSTVREELVSGARYWHSDFRIWLGAFVLFLWLQDAAAFLSD